MSAQAFSPPVPTSTPGEPSGSRVSVVIEDGVIKSRVEGALIPDLNFESFFTGVWREHEDQIALVDARCNTTYTFGELLNTSRRVAAGLRKLGLRAGDVVAFHGANSSELLVAMCGTFFAGGIGVLNKKSLNQVEIHYQLEDAKPKFVFCDSQEIEKMGQACKDITSVQEIIVAEGTCEEAHSLSELKETELAESEMILSQSPDTTLCIAYSSGTTGLPKGVQLTHRNVIAQVISYGYTEPVFERGDALLCTISIMHIGGFSGTFCYLGLGSKVVFLDTTDIPLILSTIDKYKPTIAGLYPTVIRQLDQWENIDDFDTTSLTKIIYGGAPVNAYIRESVRQKLRLKEIIQVYGMTELTSCVACSTHLDDLKSAGKPAPFFEMKVVDFQTRKPLGPNQQGEVCVKSPSAFKAYLNRPKATADAYEDGFVRTGDKGYYTADGCIFLCGRFKELIKCMDQQVYPAELEELLAADPEVRHVVVAGIPHAQYGEAARAFVVHWRSLTDPLEQQREAERLKQLVAHRLAYHKHLHGGLEFLDAIPESEYGKGARKLLAKAYVDRCHSSKASGSPMTSENE